MFFRRRLTAKAVRRMLSRLTSHLKGHILLFDVQPRPSYGSSAGVRLLLIFVLLEGILGPRLWILSALKLPIIPASVRVPLLLIVVLLLIRYFAGLQLAGVGFKPWRNWSLSERSYFIQVIVLINGIFALLAAPRLQVLFADPEVERRAPLVFFTYLVWGFYQELMYRGILQTELVRRWGVWPGILVSNILFTFGPLHFYHLSERPLSRSMPMFAAIFAIGLFFGALFRRSGNLWLVGTFHGIGDAYLSGPVTLAQPGRATF
jgi:membrane protease YdiL (CAAX protease family)